METRNPLEIKKNRSLDPNVSFPAPAGAHDRPRDRQDVKEETGLPNDRSGYQNGTICSQKCEETQALKQ